MLQVSDIPKSWRDMLDDLQSQYPPVVLAGGALRDLDHGIKVKDLDVFIQCGEDMKEAYGLAEKLGGKVPDDPEANEWYGASGMAELVAVTDYDKSSGIIRNVPDIPVQLIFCNWRIENIVKRFDYGLCQIVFDGQEVRVTDNYESGKINKQFSLVRCETENALERSIERYIRWKPRYPDHRWSLGCHISLGTNSNSELTYI